MNQPPERIEAHCPRCNAAFVIASAARGKKVQCPKCRQTVSIGLPEVTPPADRPSAQEFADLKSRLAQQTALVERLQAPLPPTVAIPTPPPPTTPPPSGDFLLRPGQSLRWFRHDAPSGSDSLDDIEQRAILLHNLRAMGGRDIVIESVLNDPAGQRLADSMAAIFGEAGWKVNPARPSPRPRPVRGLVLAAGQCPLPPAATAIFMALTAAGFSISSRIDSALGPEKSILLAGSGGDSTS